MRHTTGGSAAAVLDHLGTFGVQAGDQREYQAIIATLRSSLGDARIEAALLAGRLVPLDDALAESPYHWGARFAAGFRGTSAVRRLSGRTLEAGGRSTAAAGRRPEQSGDRGRAGN